MNAFVIGAMLATLQLVADSWCGSSLGLVVVGVASGMKEVCSNVGFVVMDYARKC